MTGQQLITTFPTFDDLPLNKSNESTIDHLRMVAQGYPCDLLLYGKHGSGKTALAELLTRWFDQSHNIFSSTPIFFDCSKGLDLKRLEKAQTYYATMFGSGTEWFILDEVDKVEIKRHTNAVLGVMHDCDLPRRFILTANDLTKVHPGVLDRCEVLEIVAPRPEEYLPYAQKRLRAEGIMRKDADVLKYLKSKMQGSLRRAEREIEYAIARIKSQHSPSIVAPAVQNANSSPATGEPAPVD